MDWRRIIKAYGYSIAGLQAAWKNEAAFRLEVWLFVFLCPAALLLGRTGVERAILMMSLLLVIVVELINSAIEAVADRFGAEWHVLITWAKDCGSAAVFITLLQVCVVWGLILLDF
jgi:diacylglycerol kinase (ATP)